MHTPGPWLQSSTVLVCNKEARVIANCTPLVDIPELSLPMSQVDANARLIAAAPELLAALEDVLDRLGALSNPNELYSMMEKEDADKVYDLLRRAGSRYDSRRHAA